MVLKWLFGRNGGDASPGADAPGLRPGPGSSRPAAPGRPGVTVHAASAVGALAGSPARPGVSRVGPYRPGSEEAELAWAAVSLSGPGCGDVLVAGAGTIGLPEGGAAFLDGVPRGPHEAALRIARDELTGAGFAGVTGARLLARTSSRAVLRLGPPPAARWVVVGLRGVAVLGGKLTLYDGEEGCDVRAGEVAFVADPEAPLPVQAGNDAAVAIGFASPGVVVRLG